MARIIDKSEKALTTQRRVVEFKVETPEKGNPKITIIYADCVLDPQGEVLNQKTIAVLNGTVADMTAWLPEGNKYGLPTYPGLYAGLRDLFDDLFEEKFPYLAPEES